ncbi:hypothetical protein KSP39_PZI006634 [Platanthera zijinensis]|uniref:Uncharacterized protein n=1 Tax=Platanthera zijinensis TaxID=2320716 RepID=A0AAP0BP53_9ASPA
MNRLVLLIFITVVDNMHNTVCLYSINLHLHLKLSAAFLLAVAISFVKLPGGAPTTVSSAYANTLSFAFIRDVVVSSAPKTSNSISPVIVAFNKSGSPRNGEGFSVAVLDH